MNRPYVRQKSISSNASEGTPSSPMKSPMNRHGSTGIGNFRKTPNNATKAAAQRLAQVMAHQHADDDDDDDDDLSIDYNPPSTTSTLGLSGRSMRSRTPAVRHKHYRLLRNCSFLITNNRAIADQLKHNVELQTNSIYTPRINVYKIAHICQLVPILAKKVWLSFCFIIKLSSQQ